jgi:hypothetical protein
MTGFDYDVLIIGSGVRWKRITDATALLRR